MATQRELTDAAFDEIRLSTVEQQAKLEAAMREQQVKFEAATREHQTTTQKSFDKVKLAMLEDELAAAAHFQEVHQAVGELAQAVKDHEARLREQEGKPPAA